MSSSEPDLGGVSVESINVESLPYAFNRGGEKDAEDVSIYLPINWKDRVLAREPIQGFVYPAIPRVVFEMRNPPQNLAEFIAVEANDEFKKEDRFDPEFLAQEAAKLLDLIGKGNDDELQALLLTSLSTQVFKRFGVNVLIIPTGKEQRVSSVSIRSLIFESSDQLTERGVTSEAVIAAYPTASVVFVSLVS